MEGGFLSSSSVQNLAKLHSLLLSDLALTGTIPSELGKLTELEDLQLACNELVGGIPTEFGLLTKLTSLTFIHNDLEGTIPSEVCSLKTDGDLKVLGMYDTFGMTATCASFYGGLECPTNIPDCCIDDCRD